MSHYWNEDGPGKDKKKKEKGRKVDVEEEIEKQKKHTQRIEKIYVQYMRKAQEKGVLRRTETEWQGAKTRQVGKEGEEVERAFNRESFHGVEKLAN